MISQGIDIPPICIGCPSFLREYEVTETVKTFEETEVGDGDDDFEEKIFW